MSVAVTVPPLNSAEARVARWLVKPGQDVKAGQPIVTIAAGSVEIDVEAPVSGRLTSVRVADGGRAGIGDTLGEVG